MRLRGSIVVLSIGIAVWPLGRVAAQFSGLISGAPVPTAPVAAVPASAPAAPAVAVAPASARAAPRDRITGLALPLQPWQRIVPFADGRCGAIVPTSATYARAGFSWQGACRFGLAHGPGYSIGADGRAYSNTWFYGWRIGENRAVFRDRSATYYDDWTDSPTYRRVVFSRGRSFDPRGFDRVEAGIALARVTASNADSFFFGVRAFPCPFKAFTDAPDISPNSEQRRAAGKVCSHDPYRQDGGLNVWVEMQSYDIVNAEWVRRGPVRHQAFVCRKELAGDTPDCSQAIQTAIAPYLDEINAVIAADATAAARAQAEAAARFKPLEDAARSRRVAWARALAASYTLRPAPQPPTPFTMPAPPAKGNGT